MNFEQTDGQTDRRTKGAFYLPPNFVCGGYKTAILYHFLFKGYIADEFGPEITQNQKEEAKDGDGEDGPRPKQPRSSADKIGTSEVWMLAGIIVIKKTRQTSLNPSNLLY